MIRPTGLGRPQVEIRSVKGQVDDLLEEIRVPLGKKNERVLVTTLTKRMAEDLSNILRDWREVPLLHSEVETLDRSKSCAILRRGEFDVPHRNQSAARRLGFCRKCRWWPFWMRTKKDFCGAPRLFIQTIGRCARHIEGEAILYADGGPIPLTSSIEKPMPSREASRLQPGEQHHPNVHHQVRGYGARRIVEATT